MQLAPIDLVLIVIYDAFVVAIKRRRQDPARHRVQLKEKRVVSAGAS
jgi:hypothetical protein